MFLDQKDSFQSTTLNTYQNTWRNIVVGFVLSGASIVGGLYFLHSRLYTLVQISGNNNLIVQESIKTEVKGAKKYVAYMIGGDISFDSPPVYIPKKRDMFIPFDTRLISAVAVIVKDMGTGQVLFGEHEYTPRSLASVTKLMSALVLEEDITDWNTTGTVPVDTIFDSHVAPGEVASLNEWYAVGLVGSSNRAILTLVDATGVGREKFIFRMNEKARELGMSNTRFTDPTGIDAENISTASDAALLLAEALRNERVVKTLSLHSIDHTSSITNKTKTISSTNWLLTDWVRSTFTESVIGKTGYILESDYNFVGKFTKDTDQSIEVIVLGSHDETSRFTDAAALAEWAFTNYEWTLSK